MSASASLPVLQIVTHKACSVKDSRRSRDDMFARTKPVATQVIYARRPHPRRKAKKTAPKVATIPDKAHALAPAVAPVVDGSLAPAAEEAELREGPELSEGKKRDYGYGVPQWSPYFVPKTVTLVPHESVSTDYGLFTHARGGALDPAQQCRVSPIFFCTTSSYFLRSTAPTSKR